MKAIILAAGRGSRMGENTKDMPKCLTKLFGKTLFEQQISKLSEAKVESIGAVRGYKPDKIDFAGITYFENIRWSESNMVTSLTCADEWLSTEECIISYSDILYETEAIRLLKDCKENIAITYNTNWLDLWKARFDNPLDDAETFQLDSYNYVKEIGGRANNLDEIKGQYMGLLKITPAGWQEINKYLEECGKERVDKMDMTSLLSNLIKRGVKVYGIPYDGLWLEVDNENDLRLYEKQYESI